MSHPTGPNQTRLEDLWRPPSATGSAARGLPSSDDPLEPDQPAPPARRRFGPLAVELFLAALVSAAIAVAMNWEVARRLGAVLPGDADGDPYPGLWALGWAGHALDPSSGIPLRQALEGNTFHPAPHSFALVDQLFGYGPLTWFFTGDSGLVTAYGVIFVAGAALTCLGGYALARQLGAHPVAAFLAGAALAYPPWRLGQLDDLYLLAAGPMVIALALLARGHGLTMSGRRTPPRPLWALLGWLVAAWQLTVGVDVNLPFVYLLALVLALTLLTAPFRLLAAGRRRRRREAAPEPPDPYAASPYASPYADLDDGPPTGRRRALLGLVDVVGIAVFAAAAAAMAYPLLRIRSSDPAAVTAAQSLAQVQGNSPEPLGLVTPPTADGIWSRLADTQDLVAGGNDVRLLPGIIVLELAVLGLVLSSWRWWWRVLLALAAVVFAGLSLGTGFPSWFPGPRSPFEVLREQGPGWEFAITPGRLVVFTTLALALLAAGATGRLAGRDQTARRRPTAFRALMVGVLLLLPALVVAEGWAGVPVTPVPPVPAALREAPAPTVVLPSSTTGDGRVMFWTTQLDYPVVGNGQGAITPSSQLRLREALAAFPDTASVSYLRDNGFRSVVVLKNVEGSTGATPVPTPSPSPTPSTLGTVPPSSVPPLTVPSSTGAVSPAPTGEVIPAPTPDGRSTSAASPAGSTGQGGAGVSWRVVPAAARPSPTGTPVPPSATGGPPSATGTSPSATGTSPSAPALSPTPATSPSAGAVPNAVLIDPAALGLTVQDFPDSVLYTLP